MAQRVRKSYRGRNRPSSATQLPILAALHAGLPTLFAINIHDLHAIVKTQMEKFSCAYRFDSANCNLTGTNDVHATVGAATSRPRGTNPG